MVDNQNKEIVNRISEDVKESNVALLPKTINNSIQPVLIANPLPQDLLQVTRSGTLISTGEVAIFTTPTDKDFYLTNWFFGFFCDATADTERYYLAVTTADGFNTKLVDERKLPLTADRFYITQNYNIPIKLKRGTEIVISQDRSVGTSKVTGIISGYFVDTLKKS